MGELNRYYKGQEISLQALFYNDVHTLVNPSTVLLSVRSPSGVITTPAFLMDSTGSYHGNVVANESGKWSYRWESSGTVVSAAEGGFQVSASDF